MHALSSGCGWCLSKGICCDLLGGKSPCLTCRDYNIKCRPAGTEAHDSEPEVREDDLNSPMEDVLHTPEAFTDVRFELIDDAASPPIHYMAPLDHYKSVAHDLLGFPVPGLPDVVQPTYTSSLPPFIQRLSALLPDEDVKYLTAKGVFGLPDETLRNELLKTFVLHVHPYLPMLDLPAFLTAVACNDGESRVSLLLFHAVMFSSIAFVDSKHILRAGYTSRIAARQEFFRKARILYDFDVERDRIVIIQSVLLMTYWHETPEDPKDFRYWLEIALSLAASVAFHNSSEWASETASRSLWKRIWWCMYTCDRLNALHLRRAAIINDEEFTVPLPTLADFDIQRYPGRVTMMLGDCEVLRRVDQQQQLAQMFIEKSKLCCTVSGIIYPIAKDSSVSSPSVFTHSIRALEDWHAKLPSEIHYRPPLSRGLSEGERALFAYRAWLKMIFLGASGALHRHWKPRESTSSTESVDPPETGLQSVTRSLAVVAEGLSQLDLVHCLPTTTVGLLVPVVATHIMNIRSETPDLWGNALQSLYECIG